jgi:hypothetical protein
MIRCDRRVGLVVTGEPRRARSTTDLQSLVSATAADVSPQGALRPARDLVIEVFLGLCARQKPAIDRQSLFVSQINEFFRIIEAKMHDFASSVHHRICDAASEALASAFKLRPTRRVERIAKP